MSTPPTDENEGKPCPDCKGSGWVSIGEAGGICMCYRCQMRSINYQPHLPPPTDENEGKPQRDLSDFLTAMQKARVLPPASETATPKRLWDYMAETHKLNLLESEINDIRHAANAEAQEQIRNLSNSLTAATRELEKARKDTARLDLIIQRGLTVAKDQYAGGNVWACFEAYPDKPATTGNPFLLYDSPRSAIDAATPSPQGNNQELPKYHQ